MERKNIIMDCDPGIDDAVAMCLVAANQDRLKLHGVVAVSGNLGIDQVTENALRLTSFLGLDVPVARGSEGPLLREIVLADDVHGKNGVGECTLPKTDKKTVKESGVLFLYQTIMGLPEGEKMTLVPTGPLTNIALLLRAFPEVKSRIEEICFMGGAAIGGNCTPKAEFNVFADPEAAAIVVESGVPVTMCGLDVTSQSGFDKEQVKRMCESTGRVSRMAGNMMLYYLGTEVYRGRDFVSIHDAVTFMYLLHPELYTAQKMRVRVDCSEGLNRGMTVCDLRRRPEESWPEISVLMDTDAQKFQEYLLKAITSLD